MNFRPKDWKDIVFFITTWLIIPILIFFRDLYIGKKSLKNLNIFLILDLFIFIFYIVFIILAYFFRII